MLPLISCICITRNRPALLRRAIACFSRQSYPNKELVILYERDDRETAAMLMQEKDPQIKPLVVEKSADQYLGALRNAAIEAASGAYICQWDDDDWYHPYRLQYQYDLISGKGFSACTLGRELIWDQRTEQAYISCYRHWEGSLLCRRDIALQHPYVNLAKGEDTPVLFALQQQRLLYTDPSVTPLYVYCYHGQNTWDYQHFSSFFPYSTLLPQNVAARLRSLLAGTDDTAAYTQLEMHFKQQYAYGR